MTPVESARSRMLSSTYAVIRTVGMGFPEADRWRCSSSPLILGICTSAIRQEVRRTRRELKNSSADANASTLNPNDFTRAPIASRIVVSSSMIEIRGFALGTEPPYPGPVGETPRCDPSLPACCCPLHFGKDEKDSSVKGLYFGIDRAAARAEYRSSLIFLCIRAVPTESRVATRRGDQFDHPPPACRRVNARPVSRPTQIALPSLSLRF